MAISSWMIRNRSMRGGLRGRQPPEEDCYKLDSSKTPSENAYDIYLGLSSRMTNEYKRLCLLNALAKLWNDPEVNTNTLGFTVEELLYCISASLVHQLTQIRAGALRAIRYILNKPKDIQVFNNLQLSHFVCRSLDILLRNGNEEERVQALKLVRRILVISPDLISPTIVRCLVSLGEGGTEDRMLRACLATLCEVGVLNSTLLIICGGVSVITRNVLECHSPRIAESLCGVLLHLLEWPHTRNIAGVRLECLAAPYCDFTYRLGIMDKNKDARDLRFTSSRLALLSVLRSWTGILEFCNPSKPSGLKAIVDILYLNQLEVRKAILDLLYEILGLPQPVWTDEYSVALAVVDPADFQDSWRLSDGFIAMEGRCILPSLASRVPNICEIHLSLLLYCFLENGLLNALIQVIISSDTFISVRATVLLGKLLQLVHTLLPADICSSSSTLPTLISKATEGNHQAKAAIAGLQSYHQMLRNRPASCSLFLDSIIQSGSLINTRLFKREINTQENLHQPNKYGTIERKRHDSFTSTSTAGGISNSDRDEFLHSNSSSGSNKRSSLRKSKLLNFFDNVKESEKLMKQSNVLMNKDGQTWDWDIIIALLRSDIMGKLDDTQCRFIKRLVHYFKPASNRFSHQDLGHGRHIPSFVTAGLELIDWLLQSQELECIRFLTDLFTDISWQLLAITASRSAHDCLFSPQHMSSTMCQQYFLFIGRMCRQEKGLGILKNTAVFEQLDNLVQTSNHTCYVKLIVSGLDYTLDAPRRTLERALMKSPQRAARLYATQFLLVLLRSKIPNFEIWGIPLLIKLAHDKERSIMLAALEILEEACYDRTYLEELVNIWPKLDELNDQGKLVMMKFYSIPRGLNHPNAKIRTEIEYWSSVFNRKYVLLVEANTHASLTLHYKNEDGTYSRRHCSSRPDIVPPNILPHLYSQLVQTAQGIANLKEYGDIAKLADVLKLAKCNDESESLTLKSAMWALGHFSTSNDGVETLKNSMWLVYEKIIFLAKYCEVYSVRATALNVLCLVGSTKPGADLLQKLDWICVRHDRTTSWPIHEPDLDSDWLYRHLTPTRCQIELGPYNYAGLEDNEGSYSGMNSYYTDEVETTLATTPKDTGGDQVDNISNLSTAVRSLTLPESSLSLRPPVKHMHVRSLSESKTTDGISMIAATHMQQKQQQQIINRTRFNSSTDSNTSGVSSCDSNFGRNIISELHQTLSPIPSSSNLADLKNSSDEKFRRISLTGIPWRELTINPQDIQGYATLRYLRRHCRPMLSESAADDLADFFDDDITPNIRTNRLSIIDSKQRQLKVRSLDRSYTLNSTGIDEVRQSLSASKLTSMTSEKRGPVYTGICLPRNILDLFPKSTSTGTYVSRYIQELETIDTSSNLSGLKNQLFNESFNEGDESAVSSMSDLSSNSKKIKWTGKHNRNECLNCCRAKTFRSNDGSSNSGISGTNAVSGSNSGKKKTVYYNSSMQLSDVSSFNSPESLFSDESLPDRITVQILHLVQRMANPILSKPTKMILLRLKQTNPTSFQDICLYSEICKSMGRNTYRLFARRFLQELFLDLDYDCFYNEPIEIINMKKHEKDFPRSKPQFDCDDDEQSLSSERSFNQSKSTERSSVSPDPVSTSSISKPPSQQSQSQAMNYKTLLKNSLLYSVYETSIENLEETVASNKLNDSKLSSSSSNSNTTSNTTTTTIINNNIKKHNNNNPNLNNMDNDVNATVNHKRKPRTIYTRPRFNTLELDLSCTKNKFPITDRRKEYSTSLSSGGIFTDKSNISIWWNTQPGNLYCEKRMASSKSETTLTDKVKITES